MATLHELIRRAVREDRVAFTVHANRRLAVRNIERWQLLESFEDGELLKMNTKALPNPKILVRQLLPDGMEVVAVWSYVRSLEQAKLVTAYFKE